MRKKIKARGPVHEEIKKLSPKAQKKFRDAETHARSKTRRDRDTPSEARRSRYVDQTKDKRIAKEIRATLKALIPAPPKNPYAALMVPMVVVPDDANAKPVIADAGSIVKLEDQSVLYRNRISPITRRSDEILVHYGKAKTPTLGWITQRIDPKSMKPSRGPVFLVTTKNEDAVNAWEQLRLRCARARKTDASMWIARWLALHGAKHPTQLREVTRFFGGKPIKNESTDVRIERLFSLILHTELDMASAKKGKKSKASKATKNNDTVKASKKSSKKEKKGKTAPAKKERVDSDTRITSTHDEHIIKRLVQENPRRAGSQKAKIWDKLKKGMTVGEFTSKGGSRGAVGHYLRNGWVKLLKPRGE